MKLASTSALAIWLLASMVGAADWPQWRFDAGHTASSPESLPTRLSLQWTREYLPRIPAWEDPLNQDLMPFDVIFEPVVLGDRMFVAFNDQDKVVALDIRTGEERWVFYTDGPVRLAPAAAHGKVYFVSDDGYLYCVGAADGRLVWRFLAGLGERKALGNGRLVSAWPARGGPVIVDRTVYFAGSIWPFMGTFIYALDTETGQVRWVNDADGSRFMRQPHNTPAFAGVAPQGQLTAAGKYLLVPGGRSVPAAYDRETGQFLYYHLTESGKGTGGSTVMATANEFFVHTRGRGTRAHELKNGKRTNFLINEPVLGAGHYYTASDYPSNLLAVAEAEQKLEAAHYAVIKGRQDFTDALEGGDRNSIRNASNAWVTAQRRLLRYQTNLVELRKQVPPGPTPKVVQAWGTDKALKWEIQADGSGDLIRAGGRLYAAGEKGIAIIEPPRGRTPARIVATLPVTGPVRRLLAANGHLFAVTLDGRILAFGAGGSPRILKESVVARVPSAAAVERAKTIVHQTGIKDGYAFCLGLDDQGDLLTALAAETDLKIIGVDPDTNKIERLRRELNAAGLYGRRVALLADVPDDFGAPPYIASLVVADGAFAARLAADPNPGAPLRVTGLLVGRDLLTAKSALVRVYESVRPYGGALWVSGGAALADKLQSAPPAQAVVKTMGNDLLVVREGALPGSADWTHQYGDVANSVKSDDQTVRLPVGVLWFGGNTHLDVLPRHGHGPSEQVAGGRLFIEGMDCISARDVYTGRRLWKTVIPGLDTFGIYHDVTLTNNPYTTVYNQRHIPGANARGANYVVTADRVYVAVSNHCAVLDAATGQILKNIDMPGQGAGGKSQWTYIGVYEDVLLGGSDFALFNRRFGGPNLSWPPPAADQAACNGLAAFDRHTGAVLWRVAAKYSFIHNGIVAGQGRVYCLDRWPKSVEAKVRNKGGTVPSSYRVVAYDVRTGRQVWEQTNIVSSSWLSYSKEENLLLLAGASATDRIRDETSSSMQVLKAADGETLWKRSGDIRHNGPCILYHDLILTTPTSYKASAGAFRLKDGKPHEILNPLTGQPQTWKVYRTYGCNTPIASEYLMTFRSGAAGFYDLENHSGTGNLGGFKSGCSANLIIANGILNAPDYTRTCSCPYQNQTSLGLVHMPDLEVWTCNLSGIDAPADRRVRRVGLNFGAPGDQVAPDGTVWLEYPPNSGVSPKLLVEYNGLGITNTVTNAVTFLRHSSAVSGQGHPWVMASGVRDIRSLIITPQTLRPTPPPGAPSGREDDDDDDPDAQVGNSNATNSTQSATSTNTPTSGSSTNTGFGAGKSGKFGFGKFGKFGKGKGPERPVTSASLPTLEEARYTVRLYFLEPDNLQPGQRVFDVEIQGRPALTQFDVVKEAGCSNRGVVKEIQGVAVTKDLEVRFKKSPGATLPPVLSGLELIQED